MIDGSAKSVLVAGASGYIGRAVVEELIKRGYFVYVIVRQNTKFAQSNASNLTVLSVDIDKKENWTQQLPEVDVIISCLASRSGRAQDASYVDYGLNSDLLRFACKTKVQHFILLSAICVQKPKLAFQYEKLRFQNELVTSGLKYSIVLPTAFFKSLSGQINRIKQGKSFLVFGSGRETSSLPISDTDLARFISNCIVEKAMWNKSLPVGGPGPVITPLDQAEMLFEIFNRPKKIRHVSHHLFDILIACLLPVSFFSSRIKDHLELLKIGKYYAQESMLFYDAETGSYSAEKTPKFGENLLYDYYCSLRDEPCKIPDMGSQKLFS